MSIGTIATYVDNGQNFKSTLDKLYCGRVRTKHFSVKFRPSFFAPYRITQQQQTATMINILKYLFSMACIVYVLWGVNFKTLMNSFDLLSPQSIIIAQGIILLCLILQTFRFVYITRGKSNFLTSFKAVSIGIATNAILPAKLGEIAKAVVFKKSANMTTAHSMSAIFWERFADLNCLLLIGTITAATLDMPLALLPLTAIVGTLWIALICLRCKPQWIRFLVDMLPGKSVQNFTRNTMNALSEKMWLSDYLKLAATTVAVWSVFGGFIFYVLFEGINFRLEFGQIMTVIVACILGVAIPAAPAGIGVYETLVVGALVMTGLNKEQAIALTLTLHVIQMLLPTLIGICIMSGSSFRPKELQGELSR